MKRHTRGATRERACTTAYFVRTSQGVELQVCKKSFCDLHIIGKRRVEGLSEKIKAGVLIASDGHGRHTTRPHAVDIAAKERVCEHIASFLQRQSHYSHSSNHKREYLEEGLSIDLLYLKKNLSQRWGKASSERVVLQEYYYRGIQFRFWLL